MHKAETLSNTLHHYFVKNVPCCGKILLTLWYCIVSLKNLPVER